MVQEVNRSVTPRDLIIVTTIGTPFRFRSSLGHIPERLAEAEEGSLIVIHYE